MSHNPAPGPYACEFAPEAQTAFRLFRHFWKKFKQKIRVPKKLKKSSNKKFGFKKKFKTKVPKKFQKCLCKFLDSLEYKANLFGYGHELK